MAIAGKGSRRIVVDSLPYRWLVRSRPTYVQALAQAKMTFAVDLENGGQSTLLVTVDAVRPGNWVGEESSPVTPSVVAQVIRQALAQGWSPTVRGGAFELTYEME